MYDYIRRDTVLKKAKSFTSIFSTPLIIRAIEEEPAEDVIEVKHGYWTTDDDPIFGRMCVCSVCGSCPTMEYKYCPYCGAKMDGANERP